MSKQPNSNSDRGQALPGDAGQNLATLPNGKNYLLCIGIDQYPNVLQLNNACRDVQSVQETLLSQYQFESANCIGLYNEEATKKNISDTLLKLAKEVQSNDTLLLYFAGHGHYDVNWNQGFWLPYEGTEEDLTTNIPFSFLKSQLEVIDSFHTLVVADACYAGAMFNMREIKATDEVLERLDRIPSRYLLTSGRNEVVPDGVAGTHSPFAENLLNFLRNNPDELMSIGDLSRDLIKAVAVGGNPIPRSEPIPIKGHMGGEFIFRKKGYQLLANQDLPPRQRYQFRNIEPQADPMLNLPKQIEPVYTTGTPKTFTSLQAVRKALHTFIKADDLHGLCAFFEDILDEYGYLADSILLQQGRIARYDKMERLGTSYPQDLRVIRNQIRQALIEYIKEVEEDELKEGVLAS